MIFTLDLEKCVIGMGWDGELRIYYLPEAMVVKEAEVKENRHI